MIGKKVCFIPNISLEIEELIDRHSTTKVSQSSLFVIIEPLFPEEEKKEVILYKLKLPKALLYE